MAQDVDKLIVVNRPGMLAKYGAAGAAEVEKAVKRLVAADGRRGLVAVVVDIADAVEMTKHGGRPIISSKDQPGAKRAVDALDASISPDYIMLLDGPDVIPHITLDAIPGLHDGDTTIDSDLPYASPAGYSRVPSRFLAVTRVVGRLPMTQGSKDAKAFVALIDRCATHQPVQQSEFRKYFAASAQVWDISTRLSLSAVFGQHDDLQLSPPSGHPGIDTNLGRLAHFINCHGAAGDPQFYGQQGDTYPVAMHSTKTRPKVKLGAVVAAECCFGAELYDHGMLRTAQPLCMAYLLNGAAAFLGSTTIAYGPADSNAQADLITQYFMDAVLNGASSGRALLKARQDLIRKASMSGATNLKTLVQFVLYGDPSLVLVDVPNEDRAPELAIVEQAGGGGKLAGSPDGRSMRKQRRIEAVSDGKALAESAAKPGARLDKNGTALRRVSQLAKQHGFSVKPEAFEVTGGAKYRAASKALDRQQRVVVFTERQKSEWSGPAYRVMVAHLLDDGITAVEISDSR